jgi:D-threonate/D-erythronate kinase
MHEIDSLLLADDLTGACDAAVHFAARGAETVVLISPCHPARFPSVLAINTDSRNLSPSRAECLISTLAGLPGAHDTRLIFKKIDSTLRGNPGAEIRAAMHAFRRDVAVITPAFPAMHRVVERGLLRITCEPEFGPIQVAELLRSQASLPCTEVMPQAIKQAVEGGAEFVCVDASCDADLDRIVAEAFDLAPRVLWVGSAGLASALARARMPDSRQIPTKPARRGPVLLCIGSDHHATVAQMERLTAARAVRSLDASTATRECILEAMRNQEHVLLHFGVGRVSEQGVCRLLADVPAAAVVLCGGDTAYLVSRAMGAQQIDLQYEIIRGVPWGYLRGGQFDGLPVATKSGGFGDADALIQAVDFFS